MRKIILLILSIVILVPSALCFADDTSEQLMAMLQAKMEEVAQLKAENESLRSQLQQCAQSQTNNQQQMITKPVASSTCRNEAAFVEDVTIPDGTKVAPGERFTKTWRLRNIGDCTWTTGYKVLSVGTFRMGGQQYAYMPYDVHPGETVDISVNVSAPTLIGDYASEYRLQDDKGNTFGITGTVSKKELSFWLKINVVDKSKCALVSISPSSTWRNGEFDATFKIKNNSGETWNAKSVDVKMTDGKEFLKYDKAYIDLPKTVDPGDTVTITYDMIASEEGGNHGITLQFIKDGGVYCSIYGSVTFK